MLNCDDLEFYDFCCWLGNWGLAAGLPRPSQPKYGQSQDEAAASWVPWNGLLSLSSSSSSGLIPVS